ncbi:MAG: DEAD/DEAH box helicase, partial [Candidatus Jordarchaeaceae archaeon]
MDPLKISESIKDGYVRYLSSTFRLREPNLRNSFRQEITKFQFTRGPIVEATPPFEKGCYLQELIDEGVLSSKLQDFIFDAMPYLRNNPLYMHQERAIRKIIKGRNVVIASGTSSGKTECFLIPIFNHLLREYEEKGELTPGVRALLLYPMNALANDQLRKLREIMKVMERKMSNVRITFGRYVGDTPETRREGLEKFRLMNPGEEPVESELLSREEMRESPPHILITNYAMLEYLLLRPKDSPFFDGEYATNWKFLVLDEAHVYNGATGIEMAMLIRRLKDRVCKNMTGDLQCLATSATLVREEEDFKKVADFATQLFGEKFEWDPDDDEKQDIIKGERIRIKADNAEFRPSLALYSKLNNVIHSDTSISLLNELYHICKEYGVPKRVLDESRDSCDGDAKKFLYKILSKDENVAKLRSFLEDGAKDVQECITHLTEGQHLEGREVIDLINVLVWARPDAESLPLLPARYHFFV